MVDLELYMKWYLDWINDDSAGTQIFCLRVTAVMWQGELCIWEDMLELLILKILWMSLINYN